MIFGGLEIVAGGYLIHRHYRKKNEKEQLEEEAQKRRHDTFPGANRARPSCCNTQTHHRPQHHPPPPAIPQQKYACYAPVIGQPCGPQYYHQVQPQVLPQPQPQPYVQPQRQHHPRPHALPHTQSFNIPRRPVPQRKPQIIIEPSLQRSDSFATISRMPIANGSRPQDIREEPSPVGLSPVPQHGIYGNAGFSASTPAFGATPTSPGLTYEMATGHEDAIIGRTVDDNWETYGHANGRAHGDGAESHYAPTVSTELGERDPPPPYAP
ncbi:hypothetical protein BDW02DRAFT_576948 [Decorospora gaudefroyi]|uniref:Uncharacterized protein n=1 Tax=Decorospora gaudefroyi TaxID=184978 RepID=A0A6A5KRL4_9PLEO|nr:hypothetical protein BDW02DRAFT_576948 [Decorospora gaudefroyi]